MKKKPQDFLKLRGNQKKYFSNNWIEELFILFLASYYRTAESLCEDLFTARLGETNQAENQDC